MKALGEHGKHFKAQTVFKFNRILGLSLNLSTQKSQKTLKGALIKIAWSQVTRQYIMRSEYTYLVLKISHIVSELELPKGGCFNTLPGF